MRSAAPTVFGNAMTSRTDRSPASSATMRSRPSAMPPWGDEHIDRAAQIAVEIDHPVYDCLYVACAEATASALITADRRRDTYTAGYRRYWRAGHERVMSTRLAHVR